MRRFGQRPYGGGGHRKRGNHRRKMGEFRGKWGKIPSNGQTRRSAPTALDNPAKYLFTRPEPRSPLRGQPSAVKNFLTMP